MIMKIEHKSYEEATKTIENFFVSLYKSMEKWNKQNQILLYDVLLGSNGYSISDTYINRIFKPIEKYFAIYFFEFAYNYNPNIVVYQFKVYEQVIPELSRSRILHLLRYICEKNLIEHFHQKNFYNIDVTKMVAVSLQADTLRFHIAMNNEGIHEIAELRRNFH